MTTRSTCSWKDLPFRQIWSIDTEYFPGAGVANGGRDGDLITPLCLVAVELRSGTVIRLWQEELLRGPPFPMGDDVLCVNYMTTAEAGFYLSLGWPEPAATIDAYIEFRHLMNNAAAKAADRPKGFFSLPGALRWCGIDELDVALKDQMRKRIVSGPPFTCSERAEILRYCEDDARALGRVFEQLVPTIPSLPHALHRGHVAWATARQERRGVPINLTDLGRLREHWGAIKLDLVQAMDQPYGCYEILNGEPHFRIDLFKQYLQRNRMEWPVLDSGELNLRSDTFKDMTRTFPQIGGLRELRNILGKLRLNKLQVGADGRNRTMLSPFGTKTGRNTPSNTKFIFGPTKGIRPLITVPPGLAVIYRDFAQQEVRIAAVKSGDGDLLAACEQGDVYLGIATQLGFNPETVGVRDMFKTVVLGILYGLAAPSLAYRANISIYHAAEILARLRSRFWKFERYVGNVLDYAGLRLELSTDFGWTVKCPPGTNPRTIRNWTIQAAGAEIMHNFSLLGERRGAGIVAPIHDAAIAVVPADAAEDGAALLDRCMRDGSATVLGGYELPTDAPVILREGERFPVKNAAADTWKLICDLISKVESKHGNRAGPERPAAPGLCQAAGEGQVAAHSTRPAQERGQPL